MDCTCKDIAKMIDHSLLRPELSKEDIIKGFEIARKYNVASVCCALHGLHWPKSISKERM